MNYQNLIEQAVPEVAISDKVIHYEFDHFAGMAINKQDEYDKEFQRLQEELKEIQINW